MRQEYVHKLLCYMPVILNDYVKMPHTLELKVDDFWSFKLCNSALLFIPPILLTRWILTHGPKFGHWACFSGDSPGYVAFMPGPHEHS